MHTHYWGELQKYRLLLQDQIKADAEMQAKIVHGADAAEGAPSLDSVQVDGSGNSAWQRAQARARALNSKGR
jgi:hypothetical protein